MEASRWRAGLLKHSECDMALDSHHDKKLLSNTSSHVDADDIFASHCRPMAFKLGECTGIYLHTYCEG